MLGAGLKFRLRATAWHALFNMLVAALVAILVFGLWFPGAYRHMVGGLTLFGLLVAVDGVLGPMLTFVVWNPRKSWRHRSVDVGVIVLLQVVALVYGVWTVGQVRPRVLAAENRFFRVVSQQDVKPDEWVRLPSQSLLNPWSPVIVGTREALPGDDRFDAISWAMRGYDVGTRPSFWQHYDLSRSRVVAQAVPLRELFAEPLKRQHAGLTDAIRATGRHASALKAMPVLARETDWYVLLDAQDGTVLGFVRVVMSSK